MFEFLKEAQNSNTIIALAAIVSASSALASAFFALMIWIETKKYREITSELKSLNEKVVAQSFPKLDVRTSNEVEDSGQSSNEVRFFIPVWFVNFSSVPTTMLYLHMKDASDKNLIVYNDFNRQSVLRMPLKEPINISPFSTDVRYIYFVWNNNNPIMLPTIDFEIGYKGIDAELKIQKLKYQLEKIGINKHKLVKV